jgi:hypothetical protein
MSPMTIQDKIPITKLLFQVKLFGLMPDFSYIGIEKIYNTGNHLMLEL